LDNNIKDNINVIFINVLTAIIVSFVSVIILGSINYFNFHNSEIIKTKFITEIFSYMFIAFILGIFPQLIYKLLLVLLKKYLIYI
jgi:H+/Cl- antiporter ClcA